MSTAAKLTPRSEVTLEDTWDLSSLFANDQEWRSSLAEWENQIDQYSSYQGTLAKGTAQLKGLLDFDEEFSKQGERLGAYASLRLSEDVSAAAAQEMWARIQNAYSRAGQAGSFIRPEIMAIPDELIQGYLLSEDLAPYRVMLERILRDKPHTLSASEERLMAMQAVFASTPENVFGQLTNSELKFGKITNGEGATVELTHATYDALMRDSSRNVRQTAFHQYYQQFDNYKNTIAASLAGSIHHDVFQARAREYPSAREMALFADNVPLSVYDNLINSVHKRLPAVYHYFDVRRRAMGLDKIHFYDVYVPILSEVKKRHTWDQAVDVVLKSLEPMGTEYCQVLESGLRGRWCDRYENQGKRSGAFSNGTFSGDPYILMNYQEDVLEHVFTLTHEAGHSMHSYYSARSQPFTYYNYTIFVAEVASTFNEQLLGRLLQRQAADDRERAYLINREIDSIRGTLIRQTMFAEFEKLAHEMAENDEPLTVEAFRSVYQGLLQKYFGPEFALDEQLQLECLRIPHFYRAFYVYKYATGLSAAMALSERVLSGGQAELNDYLTFLKGGCSKWPLDLLRDAGVDLEQPTAVDAALSRFEELVKELDSLLPAIRS